MIPIRDDTPRYSTPFVTYFIIALNVLIFLFELSIGGQSQRALNAFIFDFGVVPQRFDQALALHSPQSLPALSLTILTSMFLHGGWAHIFFNMLFLWIFGDNIEDRLGHFVYLIFYLLSGSAAAITHILLNTGSKLPTVGASGAIAGVMGAYFVLYPRARVMTWIPPIFFVHLPAWLFLGYWFVVQFLMGASTAIAETSQNNGGVAVWAHVGGFVAGILLIKLLPERPRRYRYASW
ncbi:MAG TPA: rhomboid family intramembrane serine protease [Terriglobales bacterium]|nr:rhomboid family intramembrane serine protease [Terriglobales bacterium]